MNHVLCGLAANAALPSELVDRLIAVADVDIAAELSGRADLSRAQAVALASRVEESAAQLAYQGRLTTADVDPSAQPVAANPEAAPALLEALTRHEPPARKAFREVARHRHATGPALRNCLADKQARPLAARHPALPPHVITELLTDPDGQVAEAAAANPSLPLAVMSDLVPRP